MRVTGSELVGLIPLKAMLDAGIDLERENREVLSRLSARAFEQWDPADVMRLKGGLLPSVGGEKAVQTYFQLFDYDVNLLVNSFTKYK